MTAVQQRPDQVGDDGQGGAPAVPERCASVTPWGELRRQVSLRRLASGLFSRAPVTVCYLAVVWVVGLAGGGIAHGPSRWLSGHVGVGLPSLGHGYWWTPLSAGLWASGLQDYLVVTALGLLILAPAEHRMGITRAFTTLLASQVAGLLLAAALVKLAVLAHEPVASALDGDTVVGALPGLLGVGCALTCTLVPMWRWRLRLLLAAAVTVSVVYIGHLEQVALAFGAAAGLFGTALTRDPAWPWAGPRGPRHQVRLLVGAFVAVPALGGTLAALAGSAHGPMTLSSLLFAIQGAGPRDRAGLAVQAGPALLLLLCAYGLYRGRRLAWWLAVVINLIVLVISVWVAAAVEAGSPRLASSGTWGRTLPVREATVLSAVTLVVLLVTYRRFDQTADSGAVRKLTATLTAALGATLCAFLLLGSLLRDSSGRRAGFAGSARDLPMRFLASMLFSNRSLPASLVGRLLYGWVFLAFWVVVLCALTGFFVHTRTYRGPEAARRARAVLSRGGSTLSYMSTWPGNSYWFSADGRAAVAYRAIAGVAITVGEPFGDPAALDSAITEFASFCEHRGLQPCLYSVTARTRDATLRLGWGSVQIAEDALIPLGSLHFAGKKWQVVRAAMNKAAREGITAEWWTYPEMPSELRDQVHEISAKWMADKGLPEMNFMLGGLDELNDPNVRCLVAVGTDRKLQAITSWLPVYQDGQPAGWTIDLMRRNTEGTVRGVMEFLIATAALAFQEEGARFVSLSGAPLAGLDRGDRDEQPRALQRALELIATAMEPAYGFQSLRQFKDKFQPDYRPLYLTYADPAALGPIAIAIGHVYLPHLMSPQGLRTLVRIRRPQPRTRRQRRPLSLIGAGRGRVSRRP
jgi:phosphatidylglycerol lysyltransferase